MRALLLLVLVACNPERADEPAVITPPATCDAGDDAWVTRAMPVLWGRRPHGTHEVLVWSELASTYGREAVVRAMMADQEAIEWWRQWMTDTLYVARAGDTESAACFETPRMLEHNGSLTAFLRDYAPDDGAFGPEFVMADVIADAFVADDVSTIYRSHLFARMREPVQGANVSAEELEYNRRVRFGELFNTTYLGRELGCVVCHNTEFSTTDDPDPLLDRTWPIPGNVEAAVYGSAFGLETDIAYSVFRYEGFVNIRDGVRVWGMAKDCGRFIPTEDLPEEDFIGLGEGFFIEPYDATGSVWDLERHLASGVDGIRQIGPAIASDGSMSGDEAFAWAVATRFVDQVWSLAMGSPLTIAYGFPRNEAQQLRLHRLTDAFVQSGWSPRALLVAVLTDPLFNPGGPEVCPADPYGFPPVLDPYATEEDDPQRRGNGPGDRVRRVPARVLFGSVEHAMEWKPQPRWFSAFAVTDAQELQAAVGVFLKESEPGFEGSDFQGLLAWDVAFGTCPPLRRSPTSEDHIHRLLAAGAADPDTTLRDLAEALEDRLLSQPLSDEERPLVEALFGARLDTRLADYAGATERHLRVFCGALLLSPQFHLVMDPEPLGAVPRLALDREADCARAVALINRSGASASCDGDVLVPGA
jgi:hypothetical protein